MSENIVIESRGACHLESCVSIIEGSEPVGLSHLRRAGSDCAIIAWGTMMLPAIAAAEKLAESGVDASGLDQRWLSPIDDNAINSAVNAANGNVLIVLEALKVLFLS